MSQPDVSVLFPVRNGFSGYPHEMFESAVMSTLGQAEVSVEIVFVDNASTDGSRQFISNLIDAGYSIRLLGHGTDLGAAKSMDDAALLAKGRYRIFQSCRSWYAPGSFARMVAYLDEHPEIGFVYGQTQYHGEREDLYTPPPFDKGRFYLRFDSLFGYMYRSEAHETCTYRWLVERDGQRLDLLDWDFALQMIDAGYSGMALRDELVLHYWLGGKQMNDLVIEHWDDLVSEMYRLHKVTAIR
jgi:GT2 family glycosyltransferase